MEKTIKLAKAMDKLTKEINEICKISNISKSSCFSAGMLVWFKEHNTKNFLFKGTNLITIVLNGVEVFNKTPKTPGDYKEALKALRLLKKKVKAFEKSCKKAA